MEDIFKSRLQKQGLSPGSLVYVGDRHGTAVAVSLVTYDAESCTEQVIDPEICVPIKGDHGISWLDIEGVSNVEVLRKVGACYGLHPLVLEDLANTDQRPKREVYDSYLFIVIKMLSVLESGRISAEQVSLILGADYLLTFQEGIDGDQFGPVRERLRTGKGKVRGRGADYLAYSLMDAVVDHYFIVLESLAERVEALEDEIVNSPTMATLRSIHKLKREMVILRRSVWPLREVIGGLERRESDLIHEDTVLFLRDLYDHTVQIIDTVETFRDMLSGMLDIYLSSQANRTNEVMKILTVYSTIFLPLTFIVGLYGMNFKFMPELEWRWGYPAVLFFMTGLAAGMLLYFRRKGWLGRTLPERKKTRKKAPAI